MGPRTAAGADLLTVGEFAAAARARNFPPGLPHFAADQALSSL